MKFKKKKPDIKETKTKMMILLNHTLRSMKEEMAKLNRVKNHKKNEIIEQLKSIKRSNKLKKGFKRSDLNNFHKQINIHKIT